MKGMGRIVPDIPGGTLGCLFGKYNLNYHEAEMFTAITFVMYIQNH